MSLSIQPIPTAAAMARALDYSKTGIKVEAKYIAVGRGFQDIKIDDAGRAITDTLKKPVAFLDILKSERVSDYQHQLTTDAAGCFAGEFNLSEIALADENKNIIAIYGHKEQALLTVSPVVDSALIAVNLVLGLFPAGSINIIHQGAPLELMLTAEKAALDHAIGLSTLAQMRSFEGRRADELKAAEERAAFELAIDKKIAGVLSAVRGDVAAFKLTIQAESEKQELFNHNIELGVARLAGVSGAAIDARRAGVVAAELARVVGYKALSDQIYSLSLEAKEREALQNLFNHNAENSVGKLAGAIIKG